MIRESVVGRMEIVSHDQAEYLEAIATVAKRGLSSGILYDALHVTAAIKTSCERIHTYKLEHFRPICPSTILLSTP